MNCHSHVSCLDGDDGVWLLRCTSRCRSKASRETAEIIPRGDICNHGGIILCLCHVSKFPTFFRILTPVGFSCMMVCMLGAVHVYSYLHNLKDKHKLATVCVLSNDTNFVRHIIYCDINFSNSLKVLRNALSFIP